MAPKTRPKLRVVYEFHHSNASAWTHDEGALRKMLRTLQITLRSMLHAAEVMKKDEVPKLWCRTVQVSFEYKQKLYWITFEVIGVKLECDPTEVHIIITPVS